MSKEYFQVQDLYRLCKAVQVGRVHLAYARDGRNLVDRKFLSVGSALFYVSFDKNRRWAPVNAQASSLAAILFGEARKPLGLAGLKGCTPHKGATPEKLAKLYGLE